MNKKSDPTITLPLLPTLKGEGAVWCEDLNCYICMGAPKMIAFQYCNSQSRSKDVNILSGA